MAERAMGVNPRVLRWARERMGLSVEEVAEMLSRDVDSIAAWEGGDLAPTYRQLEALASRYKRPIALFFFPEPPPEPDLKSEFRTLPDAEIERLEPDTRYAVRLAYAWQESLRELTGGVNPAEAMILVDVSARPGDDPVAVAGRVRTILGVSLEEQKSWRGQTQAFKQWRHAVESAGVFVFKRSFAQRDISGFCIHDDHFPLIVINNSSAHSRQTFTLFHELAHLLFGVSGITDVDDSYVQHLNDVALSIEVACNRFASEFLVPWADMPWHLFRGQNELIPTVTHVANTYCVSRELILRRLLDRGLVDPDTYESWTRRWNEEYLAGRAASEGGDYYATQAAYLGDRFLDLAFNQYRAGRLSRGELAEHLGIKARNLGKLEDFLLSRK